MACTLSRRGSGVQGDAGRRWAAARPGRVISAGWRAQAQRTAAHTFNGVW